MAKGESQRQQPHSRHITKIWQALTWPFSTLTRRRVRRYVLNTLIVVLGIALIIIFTLVPAAKSFLENHQALLATVAGLVAAGVGLYTYIDARDNDLTWRKTEFMFNEAKYLDTDPEVCKAVKVLDGCDLNTQPEDFFGPCADDAKKAEYFIGFERLFNILDRIATARLEQHVLGKEEVNKFGWYLQKISESRVISDYCSSNGYSAVIRLANNVLSKDRRNR